MVRPRPPRKSNGVPYCVTSGRTGAGSEIVNDGGEKHVKKAAANLAPSVRSRSARQLHLRNRLAAKGTLLQARRHLLAAIGAPLHVHSRLSKSAHCAPGIL